MKKLLLSSVAFLTLTQSASAELFVGLEYFNDSLNSTFINSNTNTEVQRDLSYSSVKFILGSGYTDSGSMGLTYSSDKIGSSILSEFGYYARRGFNVDSMPHFHPYFQFGLSYGILEYPETLTRPYDYDGTFGLFGGVGVGYVIADFLELQTGVDYVKRWTSNLNDLTFSGPSFRIGINIWFGSSELHKSSYQKFNSYKSTQPVETKEDDFFY